MRRERNSGYEKYEKFEKCEEYEKFEEKRLERGVETKEREKDAACAQSEQAYPADRTRANPAAVGTPAKIWILLSTLYRGGGAEVQAQMELRRRRRKGETAYLLTFDPKLKRGESREENHVNLTDPWTRAQKRLLENFDSPRLILDTEREILGIVESQLSSKAGDSLREKPAEEGHRELSKSLPILVLHLHNVTYGYPSICRAARRVRKQYAGPCVIYETIHDCRILCDKGTRLLPDGSFCAENSFLHCYENCIRRP